MIKEVHGGIIPSLEEELIGVANSHLGWLPVCKRDVSAVALFTLAGF